MGRGCKTQNACSCFECFVFPTMRIRRSATLSARASYPPRVTQTRCVLTQTTHRPSLWPKKSYRPPASWGKRRSATLSARASYPPRVTQTRCVLTQTTHRPSLWPKKSYRPPASWGKEGRSVGVFQPKGSQKDTLFLPRADGPNLPTNPFTLQQHTAASTRGPFQTQNDSATSPSYSFQPVSPRCDHILFQLQGWQLPR